MKKKTIIIISVIAVILIAVVVFFLTRSKDDILFNTTVVKNDSIQVFVTATGYVQPVNKVNVGTQVSGVIEKIYVDFNSQVTKGQLLAEIDKSTLIEKLSQAKAMQSNTESELKFAQQNYDRTIHLFGVNAATQIDVEDATNRLNQAKNALTNSSANVQQAQVNLSYAEIYSPIAGVIMNRAVDEGQTVAATFATPTLFTIGKDLTKMQVEADVDEADIGSVQIGQKVTFTVDSYPNLTFTGTVEQIRLQPIVTANVVTYTVIIEAPNPDEKLYPGMTASVSIIVSNENGLVIPIEAIRFNADAATLKQMKANKQTESGEKDLHVWVQNQDTYHHQIVKTSINDGVNILVTDGLKVGETIVLSTNRQNAVVKKIE